MDFKEMLTKDRNVKFLSNIMEWAFNGFEKLMGYLLIQFMSMICPMWQQSRDKIFDTIDKAKRMSQKLRKFIDNIKRLLKIIKAIIKSAIKFIKDVAQLLLNFASPITWIVWAIILVSIILILFNLIFGRFGSFQGELVLDFDTMREMNQDEDQYTDLLNTAALRESFYDSVADTSFYQTFNLTDMNGGKIDVISNITLGVTSLLTGKEYTDEDYYASKKCTSSSTPSCVYATGNINKVLSQAGLYIPQLDNRYQITDASMNPAKYLIQAEGLGIYSDSYGLTSYFRDYWNREENFSLNADFLYELNRWVYETDKYPSTEQIVYPEAFVQPVSFVDDYLRIQNDKTLDSFGDPYVYITQRVTLEDIQDPENEFYNKFEYEGLIKSTPSDIIYDYAIIDTNDYDIFESADSQNQVNIGNVSKYMTYIDQVVYEDDSYDVTQKLVRLYWIVNPYYMEKHMAEEIQNEDDLERIKKQIDKLDGKIDEVLKIYNNDGHKVTVNNITTNYYLNGEPIVFGTNGTSVLDPYIGPFYGMSVDSRDRIHFDGLLTDGQALVKNDTDEGTMFTVMSSENLSLTDDLTKAATYEDNKYPSKHYQLAQISDEYGNIIVSSRNLINKTYLKTKTIRSAYRHSDEYWDGFEAFVEADLEKAGFVGTVTNFYTLNDVSKWAGQCLYQTATNDETMSLLGFGNEKLFYCPVNAQEPDDCIMESIKYSEQKCSVVKYYSQNTVSKDLEAKLKNLFKGESATMETGAEAVYHILRAYEEVLMEEGTEGIEWEYKYYSYSESEANRTAAEFSSVTLTNGILGLTGIKAYFETDKDKYKDTFDAVVELNESRAISTEYTPIAVVSSDVADVPGNVTLENGVNWGWKLVKKGSSYQVQAVYGETSLQFPKYYTNKEVSKELITSLLARINEQSINSKLVNFLFNTDYAENTYGAVNFAYYWNEGELVHDVDTMSAFYSALFLGGDNLPPLADSDDEASYQDIRNEDQAWNPNIKVWRPIANKDIRDTMIDESKTASMVMIAAQNGRVTSKDDPDDYYAMELKSVRDYGLASVLSYIEGRKVTFISGLAITETFDIDGAQLWFENYFADNFNLKGAKLNEAVSSALAGFYPSELLNDDVTVEIDGVDRPLSYYVKSKKLVNSTLLGDVIDMVEGLFKDNKTEIADASITDEFTPTDLDNIAYGLNKLQGTGNSILEYEKGTTKYWFTVSYVTDGDGANNNADTNDRFVIVMKKQELGKDASNWTFTNIDVAFPYLTNGAPLSAFKYLTGTYTDDDAEKESNNQFFNPKGYYLAWYDFHSGTANDTILEKIGNFIKNDELVYQYDNRTAQLLRTMFGQSETGYSQDGSFVSLADIATVRDGFWGSNKFLGFISNLFGTDKTNIFKGAGQHVTSSVWNKFYEANRLNANPIELLDASKTSSVYLIEEAVTFLGNFIYTYDTELLLVGDINGSEKIISDLVFADRYYSLNHYIFAVPVHATEMVWSDIKISAGKIYNPNHHEFYEAGKLEGYSSPSTKYDQLSESDKLAIAYINAIQKENPCLSTTKDPDYGNKTWWNNIKESIDDKVKKVLYYLDQKGILDAATETEEVVTGNYCTSNFNYKVKLAYDVTTTKWRTGNTEVKRGLTTCSSQSANYASSSNKTTSVKCSSYQSPYTVTVTEIVTKEVCDEDGVCKEVQEEVQKKVTKYRTRYESKTTTYHKETIYNNDVTPEKKDELVALKGNLFIENGYEYYYYNVTATPTADSGVSYQWATRYGQTVFAGEVQDAKIYIDTASELATVYNYLVQKGYKETADKLFVGFRVYADIGEKSLFWSNDETVDLTKKGTQDIADVDDLDNGIDRTKIDYDMYSWCIRDASGKNPDKCLSAAYGDDTEHYTVYDAEAIEKEKKAILNTLYGYVKGFIADITNGFDLLNNIKDRSGYLMDLTPEEFFESITIDQNGVVSGLYLDEDGYFDDSAIPSNMSEMVTVGNKKTLTSDDLEIINHAIYDIYADDYSSDKSKPNNEKLGYSSFKSLDKVSLGKSNSGFTWFGQRTAGNDYNLTKQEAIVLFDTSKENSTSWQNTDILMEFDDRTCYVLFYYRPYNIPTIDSNISNGSIKDQFPYDSNTLCSVNTSIAKSSQNYNNLMIMSQVEILTELTKDWKIMLVGLEVAERQNYGTPVTLETTLYGSRRQISPVQTGAYFNEEIYDDWVDRLKIKDDDSYAKYDFILDYSTTTNRYMYDYIMNFETYIPLGVLSDADLVTRGADAYTSIGSNANRSFAYTAPYMSQIKQYLNTPGWQNIIDNYRTEPATILGNIKLGFTSEEIVDEDTMVQYVAGLIETTMQYGPSWTVEYYNAKGKGYLIAREEENYEAIAEAMYNSLFASTTSEVETRKVKLLMEDNSTQEFELLFYGYGMIFSNPVSGTVSTANIASDVPGFGDINLSIRNDFDDRLNIDKALKYVTIKFGKLLYKYGNICSATMAYFYGEEYWDSMLEVAKTQGISTGPEWHNDDPELISTAVEQADVNIGFTGVFNDGMDDEVLAFVFTAEVVDYCLSYITDSATRIFLIRNSTTALGAAAHAIGSKADETRAIYEELISGTVTVYFGSGKIDRDYSYSLDYTNIDTIARAFKVDLGALMAVMMAESEGNPCYGIGKWIIDADGDYRLVEIDKSDRDRKMGIFGLSANGSKISYNKVDYDYEENCTEMKQALSTIAAVTYDTDSNKCRVNLGTNFNYDANPTNDMEHFSWGKINLDDLLKDDKMDELEDVTDYFASDIRFKNNGKKALVYVLVQLAHIYENTNGDTLETLFIYFNGEDELVEVKEKAFDKGYGTNWYAYYSSEHSDDPDNRLVKAINYYDSTLEVENTLTIGNTSTKYHEYADSNLSGKTVVNFFFDETYRKNVIETIKYETCNDTKTGKCTKIRTIDGSIVVDDDSKCNKTEVAKRLNSLNIQFKEFVGDFKFKEGNHIAPVTHTFTIEGTYNEFIGKNVISNNEWTEAFAEIQEALKSVGHNFNLTANDILAMDGVEKHLVYNVLYDFSSLGLSELEQKLNCYLLNNAEEMNVENLTFYLPDKYGYRDEETGENLKHWAWYSKTGPIYGWNISELQYSDSSILVKNEADMATLEKMQNLLTEAENYNGLVDGACRVTKKAHNEDEIAEQDTLYLVKIDERVEKDYNYDSKINKKYKDQFLFDDGCYDYSDISGMIFDRIKKTYAFPTMLIESGSKSKFYSGISFSSTHDEILIESEVIKDKSVGDDSVDLSGNQINYISGIRYVSNYFTLNTKIGVEKVRGTCLYTIKQEESAYGYTKEQCTSSDRDVEVIYDETGFAEDGLYYCQYTKQQEIDYGNDWNLSVEGFSLSAFALFDDTSAFNEYSEDCIAEQNSGIELYEKTSGQTRNDVDVIVTSTLATADKFNLTAVDYSIFAFFQAYDNYTDDTARSWIAINGQYAGGGQGTNNKIIKNDVWDFPALFGFNSSPIGSNNILIVEQYGYEPDVVNGGLKMNQGIKIGLDRGSAVYAPFDGKITAVGYNLQNGNYVEITKNDPNQIISATNGDRYQITGVKIVFGHLLDSEFGGHKVYVNQPVNANRKIGVVGTSGVTAGDRLYMAIYVQCNLLDDVDNVLESTGWLSVDPEKYFTTKWNGLTNYNVTN